MRWRDFSHVIQLGQYGVHYVPSPPDTAPLKELIDHYIDALARHGIPLDPNEARERYRAYSFQTLMVALVSLGLGSLTERDETLRTVLARGLAAVDRLGFGEWLDRL